MVVTVHQQDVAPGVKRLDGPERGGDPGRQAVCFCGQVHAVRVGVAHVGGENLTAVRCLPDEGDPIDGQRHAAPDGSVAKSELAVELGHLGGVAERVGKIANPHGSAVGISRSDASQ